MPSSDGFDETEAPLPPPQPQRPARRLPLKLALLPWLLFSMLVGLFAFTGGDLRVVAWTVALACLLLSASFIALGHREGKNQKATVGVLCAGSVLAGTPVGLLVWDAYVEEYMRLDGGATYRKLSPADPVSSHADATMVEFASGSYVDRDNSVGYMRAGTIYCAAPIVPSSGIGHSPVENWAVGVNCCDQRGGFRCGEVGNPDARGGILVDNNLTYYTNAARMAASVFGLPEGSGDFAFVKWVEHIDAYERDLLVSGVALVASASMLYLAATLMGNRWRANFLSLRGRGERVTFGHLVSKPNVPRR